MDPDVMVTIGIPVYNAGRYLKSALDSVLLQTHRNFELLVSIDGATDDSVDIVKRYNDQRIRLLIDVEKKGIGYRLNQQVRMAKGRLFARMDADDIMFPDRIEKQVKFMLENRDIEAIGSQAVVIDGNNNIIGFRKSDTIFSSSSIQKKILFIHPTVIGRTEWFLKNPYPEDLFDVEDFYLWNISFLKSRFYVLGIPLLFYRDPPVSSINTYLKRQKQLRKALVRLHHCDLMTTWILFKRYLESILKTVIYSVLWKINLSNMLITGRNVPVPSEEMHIYSDILQNIISSDHI